jgi:NAD(P)-dependent dehydrogenase (short-subunit alcohol dehydrogenase family)
MHASRRLNPWTCVALSLAAGWIGLHAVRRIRRQISFRGKVVLITGGSRGLGLALAQEFGRHGARVAIAARDPEEVKRAADDLMANGIEVLSVVDDVRDSTNAAAMVQRVINAYGALDILVNNAGVITVGPLEEMAIEDYETSISTHFGAPLFLMNAAVRQMRQQSERGRIVNISSIGGLVAVPHLAPYVAGKFALTGLSEAFQVELARDRIFVTTVCPGLMRTGSHINAQFKGQRSEEFGWFALGSATPLSSIDVTRAARQIVSACRYGRPHLVLTWQARLLALGSACFPSTTAELLALINRLLPKATGHIEEAQPGWQCRGDFPPPILTTLPDRASARFNELPHDELR